MKANGLINSLASVAVLSCIVVGAILFFAFQTRWIGLVFIGLGVLHLAVLRFFKVSIRSVWPDMVFGIIDNGILVIAALVGADLGGVWGAIVGGAAGNAITDGFAGIFEGHIADHLKKYKIKDSRSSLSCALGKMAGCLFGAGLVFVIAWSVFSW